MQFINTHEELRKLPKNMKGTAALIDILTKLQKDKIISEKYRVKKDIF